MKVIPLILLAILRLQPQPVLKVILSQCLMVQQLIRVSLTTQILFFQFFRLTLLFMEIVTYSKQSGGL